MSWVVFRISPETPRWWGTGPSTTWVTLEAHLLQPQLSLPMTAALLTLLRNKGLCARCTVGPEKLRHWSLDQGKADCSAKQGKQVACAQNPWTPWWFGGRRFYRQNLDSELQGMWLSSDEIGTLPEHPGWLGPVVLYDPSPLSRAFFSGTTDRGLMCQSSFYSINEWILRVWK